MAPLKIETEISGYPKADQPGNLLGIDDCHSPEEWHVFKEMTLIQLVLK